MSRLVQCVNCGGIDIKDEKLCLTCNSDDIYIEGVTKSVVDKRETKKTDKKAFYK